MAEFAPLKPTDSDIALSNPWRFTHPTYQYCVGHWLFHESAGLIARDLSRYGNNGNFVNMTVANWISGQHGPALTFTPGSSHYVRVESTAGNLAVLNPVMNFTVSYWMRRTINTAPNTYSCMMSYGNTNVGNFGWAVDVRNNTGTYAHTFYKQSVPVLIASAIASPLNTWEHIVWTVTNYVAQLYVNGILRFTSGNATSFEANYATNELWIGVFNEGGGAADHFGGEIDDVRIYCAVIPAWELYIDPWAPFHMRAPLGFVPVAGATTRGIPFGVRSTAFGGGRPLTGLIR